MLYLDVSKTVPNYTMKKYVIVHKSWGKICKNIQIKLLLDDLYFVHKIVDICYKSKHLIAVYWIFKLRTIQALLMGYEKCYSAKL